MSVGTIVYRDYNTEEKQVSVEGGAVTDGATYTAQAADWTALVAAADGLTTGILASDHLTDDGNETAGAPASPSSQTNIQYVVHYHAATDPTITRTYRLPTADISNAVWFQGTTTRLDPTQAAVTAFITAFEAFVEIDGDPAVVDYIEYEND